jgi:outer membrane autotransporter protein
MIKSLAVSGLRWKLLMGASLVAISAMSGPVLAVPACGSVGGGANIGGSETCQEWTDGSFSVGTTGSIISADTDFAAVSIAGGFSVGDLSNAGTIAHTGFKDAIDNLGTIGTITNSGTISAGAYGILNHSSGGNSGKITLIDNSGLISGSHGIENYASIGTIKNSGTIKATAFAIFSKSDTGLIIENSGTIAGNIGYGANDSATGQITISGGADDTHYGVLTGKDATTEGSDSVGFIRHNSGDLHFGSGYLLLNDKIDVTDHSVINSAATLKLVNTVSITGNYTQTGGGLVVQAATASNFGSLAVSGNAAISNTTLVMSGNDMKVGETYTIVGAGGTGTYAITKASVVGTSGLGATTATVGKDLVVTITDKVNGYKVIGTPSGSVGSSFGATLDKINNSSSTQAVAFQNNVLAAINSLPSSQQGSAIKKLAPASAANNVQVLNQASAIVQTAIQGRQLLAMSGGTDTATGIAAGGDVKYSTLWGQVLGGSAHMEGNSDQDGFSSKSFGLTTGFDHLLTPDLLAGAAVSWLRSWTDGSNASSGSSNKIDSYQVTLYGSWRQDRLSVDGQLGAGWNHFDQKRQIDFLGSTASADYDGQQYSASSRVGYDFALGDSTTLTPFAGLRWIHARNESYDETGAGSANNSVDNLNTDSVTHEIGAKAAWQFDTGLGMVSPEVSAAWVHDYTSSAIDTTGRIGGTAFSVQSERLPSDGARIGIAVGLDAFASGSLRVTYDGELRAGYQSQTATVRADWDF